jgi:hypothetical protein
MKLRMLIALAGMTAAATGFAQTPAAPAKVAPHTCQKPGEHPGKLASDANRRKWTTDANAYLECVKKYVNDNTTSYNQVMSQAKPYADAANAATTEYNDAVKSLKEQADKNN